MFGEIYKLLFPLTDLKTDTSREDFKTIGLSWSHNMTPSLKYNSTIVVMCSLSNKNNAMQRDMRGETKYDKMCSVVDG